MGHFYQIKNEMYITLTAHGGQRIDQTIQQ